MTVPDWDADPNLVAPQLLGWRLASALGGHPAGTERTDGNRDSRGPGVVVVRLTEVEAYGGVGADPGSHAHRGRTRRNATMFGSPGHAYVYFTYGMHWCVNVVIHPPGVAGAVLLRAGEIVAGVEVARARRPSARTDQELAQGPARLTVALGIDGSADGLDLLDPSSPLRLLPPIPPSDEPARGAAIGTGPRTGVGGAGAHAHWRYFLTGEPTVSRHRPATPRRRARWIPGPRTAGG
jgi:DNA-3-methyladenine glycosylase